MIKKLGENLMEVRGYGSPYSFIEGGRQPQLSDTGAIILEASWHLCALALQI